MAIVLSVLLVIAIAVIAFLLTRNRPSVSPSAGGHSAGSDEEEGTIVRVVGPRLIRMSGGVRVGAEVPIVGVVSIGRGTGATLSLADPELSSQHAEVRADSSGVFIIDKGSTNGTAVNGARIVAGNPHPLNDGDRIRLGNTELLFKSAA